MLAKVKTVLEGDENKETFFARIERLWPCLDNQHRLIKKAYNDAKDAFRDKFRDDGETRYFEHIRAVALIVIDYLRVVDADAIIAALMHDIVEDCPQWTVDRVRAEYGDRVALYVDYLSKPEMEDKQERNYVYHDRLTRAPRAVLLIKLADRLHNLLTLWNCSDDKKIRKIEETRRYYLPLAEREIVLFHELLAAVAELEA